MQLEACLPDFQWDFTITAIAYIYNCISVRCLKQRTPQEIFLENKPKTLYFHVFGYGAYVFLPIEICANKLVSHSELIIFIGYENNKYCFMCYTQGNTISHSIHAIFDERLFSKCTNSYAKQHKLYNELLDKTSPETELLVPNSSEKDGSTLVSILHTSISPIQKNPPTYSSSHFLSYKSIFSPPTLGPKKLTVEIEAINNVDSDGEM